MSEQALHKFIKATNERATKLDQRVKEYMLPRGYIVASYCKNGEVILVTANGNGGLRVYHPDERIVFSCVEKNKSKSLWSKLKSLLK